MKTGNIKKAATFKSFLHISYKTFFVTVFFSIFMRQTLIDDFEKCNTKSVQHKKSET